MNPTLIKNKVSEAIIAGRRFVKPGSAANSAILAAAATDAINGISDSLGAEVSGDRVDVVKSGIAELELGGTVTAGAMLSSDASGKGIVAVTEARIGAIAETAGVSGDIIEVLVCFGREYIAA